VALATADLRALISADVAKFSVSEIVRYHLIGLRVFHCNFRGTSDDIG
jgi:hypothetical protein